MMILCLVATLAATFVAEGQVPEVHVRGFPSSGDGDWNAESFGWFYYDLDEGRGGEQLRVEVDGRKVEESTLVYSSEIWTEEFEFEDWGRYQAIAFLGKRYLAGYLKSDFTKEVSSLEDGELREVLIDDDEVHVINLETPLILGDGYVLKVAGMTSDGSEAYLNLLKNEEVVDGAILRSGETYIYEMEDDLPVILVHISNTFCGRDCGIVDVDGIFQVRNPPLMTLKVGDLLGMMEVYDISNEGVELQNREDLNLHRDGTIPLVGELMFKVSDKSSLEYYPVGVISDYGIHEIRGPVYTEDSKVPIINTETREIVGYAQARWNHWNFSGFYFDDDENVGFESLLISKTEGRKIGRAQPSRGVLLDGMQYVSFAEPLEFDFDGWGRYNVICLFGQLWFAGYGASTSPEIGKVNLLGREQVGQVLIDSGEEIKVSAGGVYFLEENYEIHFRDLVKEDVEEDRIFIELRRDGKLLDSAVIKPDTTYVYEKDVGDVDDLPTILLHVRDIFIEENEKFAIVDGLFQVSDRLYLPIDSGNDFGELMVYVTDPRFVMMINPDPIELKRDSDVSLWPGMNIAVADSNKLRYWIYTKEYVIPPPKILGVHFPDDNVSSIHPANFSMAVLAGEIQSVTTEIVDSEGLRMSAVDLTPGGMGSKDQWFYFWQWDVTVMAFSDDGSLIPHSELQGGMLYLNDSADPVDVVVKFDESGRIGLIEGMGGAIYYISESEHEKLDLPMSYAEILRDETLRERYIQVEPGSSKIRFYEFINGNPTLSENNHTLWLSLESLEPHLAKIDAPPGRYELRVRVENPAGALWATEHYFNVTEPDRRSFSVGSGEVKGGETVTIPLKAELFEGETRIGVLYDPEILTLQNVSGCIHLPESEEAGEEAGKAELVIPGNCTFTNLTFKANYTEATSQIQILPVRGPYAQEVTNGTITVFARDRDGISDGEEQEASGSPSALIALAVLWFATIFMRRGARPPSSR